MMYLFDNYDCYSICDNPFGYDEIETFETLADAKEYLHGKHWTWGN